MWSTWNETRRFGGPDPFERDMGPQFLAWLDGELGRDATVVDVGTGHGRVALHVAPRVRAAVGLDVDERGVAAATADAQRRGLANARFAVADCERDDLVEASGLGRAADVVTMHLCVSAPMLKRAALALRAGGAVVGVAHEAQRWKETGMPSHHAATRAQLEDALAAAGLALDRGRVETSVTTFADAAECERYLHDGHSWAPWQGNGRWESWRRRLAADPAASLRLTRSHLVFLARKP